MHPPVYMGIAGVKQGATLLFCCTALCTFTAIVIVGYIFNDIERFYEDALADINQSKSYASDAWKTMHHSGKYDEKLQIHTALHRRKRQFQDSICKCAERARNCPVGPQGPPGLPGENGENGLPGEPGLPGNPGISVSGNGRGGCIACPAGPPGQQGPDGSVGSPGPDGLPGPQSTTYEIGPPGPSGPPGDEGVPGIPGQQGFPGNPGQPGTTMRGLPGPPGLPGSPGPIGPMGTDGTNGGSGSPGPQGYPGLPGRPGVAGSNGSPGSVGDTGEPGKDGEYCPCPPRAALAVANSIVEMHEPIGDTYAAIPPRAIHDGSVERLSNKRRSDLTAKKIWQRFSNNS